MSAIHEWFFMNKMPIQTSETIRWPLQMSCFVRATVQNPKILKLKEQKKHISSKSSGFKSLNQQIIKTSAEQMSSPRPNISVMKPHSNSLDQHFNSDISPLDFCHQDPWIILWEINKDVQKLFYSYVRESGNTTPGSAPWCRSTQQTLACPLSANVLHSST